MVEDIKTLKQRSVKQELRIIALEKDNATFYNELIATREHLDTMNEHLNQVTSILDALVHKSITITQSQN